MKLERQISRWALCSPKAMSQMSPAAIEYALADARKDILTLGRLVVALGYPRRGTDDENHMALAKKAQELIPHEEAVELR